MPLIVLLFDTHSLQTILFATPVVEMVLETPAAKIAKCSVFDFMSEASKDEANRQIQRVKATEHLGYLSFDWISSKGSLIQCDAILTIAWDGKCTMVVTILTASRPGLCRTAIVGPSHNEDGR